jgi:hypothetical protein
MQNLRTLGVVVLSGLLAVWALAQRPEPREETVGDGILLHVLPPDSIPAIDSPEFVSAKAAGKFMQPNEVVLGLYDGKVAKAYSLWHLDHHEIVNDSLPGLGPVAVTW